MSNKFDYVKTKREDVEEIPERIVGVVKFFMKHYTRFNVWVYKKSNGKLMKNFPGGYPICIVGMTGKKSGKRREVALIHLPGGKNKYLVASQGGLNKHPTWYFNVKANPIIDIMFQGNKQQYQARQLSSDEKRDAWPTLLALYPDFDEYQARTDRDIPVFICTPG